MEQSAEAIQNLKFPVQTSCSMKCFQQRLSLPIKRNHFFTLGPLTQLMSAEFVMELEIKRFYIMRIIGLFIFLLTLNCCTQTTSSKIALQPFDNFDQALVDTLVKTVEHTYNAHVVVLPTRALPPEAFVNTKTPRYRADILIKFLKGEKSDTIDFIVGLTDRDISTAKKNEDGSLKKPESKYADWGIFGLGYQPGVSCVVSTYRLRHSENLKFVSRLKKVTLHELGHNMGLTHCDSELCLMRDAVETIKTIDHVNLQLCDNCKHKIN